MGQGHSAASRAISAVAISREEFLQMVEDLNNRCQLCFAESRVKMLFAIKNMDENSVMWKRTVRVNCYTMRDGNSFCKVYDLLDFFKFHRSLAQILDAAEASAPLTDNETAAQASTSNDFANNEALMRMSIFQESCSIDGLCIICFDAKPNVVLPCAHVYCESCVRAFKWANHNSCPLCRHKLLQANKECYEIVERPEREALCNYVVEGAQGHDLAVMKDAE